MGSTPGSIPGIPETDGERLIEVFTRYPGVKKVVLYGSRAKGTHAPASDIDLCIVGSEIDLRTELQIEREIDDLLLPYMIDLSVYEKIDNVNLREHIDRVAVTVFEQRVTA